MMASTSPPIVLTLPLSCAICIDRVKTPVICPSGHAFCQKCLEPWLLQHPHCPTCRVEIDSHNSLRTVIGGHLEEPNGVETEEERDRQRDLRAARLLQTLTSYDNDEKLRESERKNTLLSERVRSLSLALPSRGKTGISVGTQVSVTPSSAEPVHEDLIQHCENQAQRIAFLEEKLKEKDGKLVLARKEAFSFREEAGLLKQRMLTLEEQDSVVISLKQENTRLLRALEATDAHIERMTLSQSAVSETASEVAAPPITSIPTVPTGDSASSTPVRTVPKIPRGEHQQIKRPLYADAKLVSGDVDHRPVEHKTPFATGSSPTLHPIAAAGPMPSPVRLSLSTIANTVASLANQNDSGIFKMPLQSRSANSSPVRAPQGTLTVPSHLQQQTSLLPSLSHSAVASSTVEVTKPIDPVDFYGHQTTMERYLSAEQVVTAKNVRRIPSGGNLGSNWVSCDACNKWRRLPDSVDVTQLPDRWYCFLNKNDPSRQSCSVPEEPVPTTPIAHSLHLLSHSTPPPSPSKRRTSAQKVKESPVRSKKLPLTLPAFIAKSSQRASSLIAAASVEPRDEVVLAHQDDLQLTPPGTAESKSIEPSPIAHSDVPFPQFSRTKRKAGEEDVLTKLMESEAKRVNAANTQENV